MAGNVKVEMADDEGVGDELFGEDVFSSVFGGSNSSALDLLLPEALLGVDPGECLIYI